MSLVSFEILSSSAFLSQTIFNNLLQFLAFSLNVSLKCFTLIFRGTSSSYFVTVHFVLDFQTLAHLEYDL